MKHFNISNILISLLFLLNLNGFSQSPGSKHEKLMVHINKQVLVSGSILKYKVYLLNTPLEQSGTIVYFEISSVNQEPVLQWKSVSHQNTLSGRLLIPENIPHGFYTLRAYTNASRAYPDGCFESPLMIQEIYEEPENYYKKTGSTPQAPQAKPTDQFFQVSCFADSLQEKITIQIQSTVSFNPSQLSVSISEISPFDTLLAESAVTKQPTPAILPPKYMNVTPEHNFSLVAGQLLTKSGQALSNRQVFASKSSSVVNFLTTRTDTLGRFYFAFDTTFNQREILLQLPPDSVPTDSILWLLDNKRPLLAQGDSLSLVANAAQNRYLHNLQKRELLSRIFNPIEKVKQTPGTPEIQQNFFDKPRYIVYPDDFESLQNFKEISDNILPAVRFKPVDTSYQIGLVLENQQIVYHNVLVCVNGHPFFDRQQLAGYSSKNIARIEVFNALTFWGENTFNGVVALYTKSAENFQNKLTNSHMVLANHFYQDSYKTLEANPPQNPTVLPDIYWNPQAELDKDRSLKILLNPVDLGKYYRLKIMGLTNQALIPYQCILTIPQLP